MVSRQKKKKKKPVYFYSQKKGSQSDRSICYVAMDKSERITEGCLSEPIQTGSSMMCYSARGIIHLQITYWSSVSVYLIAGF